MQSRWVLGALGGVMLAALASVEALAKPGDPLPGIDVGVQQGAGGLSIHQLTDAHGVATFQLKGGSYKVRADVMKLLLSSSHRYMPYMVIMVGKTKTFEGEAVGTDNLPLETAIKVPLMATTTVTVTLTDDVLR
jgi:hypothetical protein